MKRGVVVSALLGLGALVLSGCASGGAPADGGQSPRIVAHGVGKVTGAPDVATVALGVQTRAGNAKEALAANNRQSTALIAMLKGKGIADADLQTSQLSVNPTYGNDSRITGYEVTNQVTAKVRNMASAGEIIDAAAEAAGDAMRVQQLSFAIDDDSGLRARARADAVKQAQAQARQMAEAAGVKLGAVRAISEIPIAMPPSPMYKAEVAGAYDRASVPVQPGTQELSVSVDVVYDIG
ncbi:SIMPL domain-containing protein [Pseudonocardia eucalypti]|uniref:SIMPL domain-containing protein n=1 Tax=Pseudonocardia eucalypti TaxID=648755 RepID=A0ABP9Q021_9PSEU|nr:uncharacterized protein YggE [Pseudonocardia eucalypti]